MMFLGIPWLQLLIGGHYTMHPIHFLMAFLHGWMMIKSFHPQSDILFGMKMYLIKFCGRYLVHSFMFTILC